MRTKYLEILEHKKFCTSELPIIEKIEKMELHIKTAEIDQIMNQVEKAYGVELINCLEKERHRKEEEESRRKEEEERLHPERSNSYIEMSLKQKIEYFFNLVFRKLGEDLNDCRELGRELLVSNDGKCLFFCKLHLGI